MTTTKPTLIFSADSRTKLLANGIWQYGKPNKWGVYKTMRLEDMSNKHLERAINIASGTGKNDDPNKTGDPIALEALYNEAVRRKNLKKKKHHLNQQLHLCHHIPKHPPKYRLRSYKNSPPTHSQPWHL